MAPILVVNNAGIIRPKSLKRGLTEEDFRTMWDVHVTGSFRVTKAVWVGRLFCA